MLKKTIQRRHILEREKGQFAYRCGNYAILYDIPEEVEIATHDKVIDVNLRLGS